MKRHELSELVRVRQLRVRLAEHQAARLLAEHKNAQSAVDEIRRRIAEYERQVHAWSMPETPAGGATSFDAGYMHNLMNCRDQAQVRAREATASIPRAELARQRAQAAAREARQAWSRAARRADAVDGQWKQTQRTLRRRQLDNEEELLVEERRAGARVACVDTEERR